MYIKEASYVAKKTFDEYDKNKDGYLTKDELRPLLIRIANLLNLPIASERDIEEGMRKLDLNRNGVLEFNEFFQFFLQIYQELKDK